MPPRPDVTDPESHLSFQRRFWAAQRAGWGLMGLLVVLALAGLTGGGGPLARAEARGADGLDVSWDRFGRLETAMEWTVALPPGRTELTIAGPLLGSFRVDTVVPRPRSEEGTEGAVTLRFEDSGHQPLTLTVHATPLRAGRLTGRLSAGPDRPSLPVSLFVFP